MNVYKLKQILSFIPDDMEVVMPLDGEWTEYGPLELFNTFGIYTPESIWHGNVKSITWTARDCEMTEAEWIEFKKRPCCLVLGALSPNEVP